MAQEMPRDHRPRVVLNRINWLVYAKLGLMAALGGVLFGGLALTPLWIVLLPIYFLPGWGVGPGDIDGEWACRNWPWLVGWFSVASGIYGAYVGAEKLWTLTNLELLDRQWEWDRRQRPEVYADDELPK